MSEEVDFLLASVDKLTAKCSKIIKNDAELRDALKAAMFFIPLGTKARDMAEAALAKEGWVL